MRVLLIVALLWTVAAPLAVAKETAWSLKYDNKFLGPCSLLINNNAVKVENVRGGYIITSHAPDWKVTIYNKRSHIYFDSPLSQFTGVTSNIALSMHQSDIVRSHWIKGAAIKIKGLPAREYKLTNTSKGERSSRHRWGGAGFSSGDYCAFEVLTLNPTISEVLTKVCMVPRTTGVPATLDYKDWDETSVAQLRTTFVKEMPVEKEAFVLPRGYKRAKKEADVYSDANLEDVIDTFGGFSK